MKSWSGVRLYMWVSMWLGVPLMFLRMMMIFSSPLLPPSVLFIYHVEVDANATCECHCKATRWTSVIWHVGSKSGTAHPPTDPFGNGGMRYKPQFCSTLWALRVNSNNANSSLNSVDLMLCHRYVLHHSQAFGVTVVAHREIFVRNSHHGPELVRNFCLLRRINVFAGYRIYILGWSFCVGVQNTIFEAHSLWNLLKRFLN